MALAAIAGNLELAEDGVSTYQIHRDMEINGFTKIAANLALRSLAQMGYIEDGRFEDYENGGYYSGYSMKESGWEWMLRL